MQKVSVITISYNCESEIEPTLKSVIAQDYKAIEFVVIDGASKDRTFDIISEYKNDIDVLVSEADKGIYDAMNKGVQKASGDWVIFMNAGDTFYNEKAISSIMSKADEDTQLLYGDHEVVYDHLTKVKSGIPVENLWKGMICSHQALFVKRELLLSYPFEWKNWKISADFHFIFNRWQEGYKFQHVPVFIAKFAAGGLSEVSSVPSKIETWSIVKEKINTKEVDDYYSKLIRYEKLVNIPRNLLGAKSFELLMKLKNKITGKKLK
ncbi:glycosyltransferase family 2 protein [Flammeovirga kamogawensis]|uniref:Glycosyltransferase n=1 Tax=Flammeovirga kamogawensis TaxID=373891 RepID=A0ABX8GZ83_9BACT|nr:glycosyltransferase family 2 protein [Flammeovirga kamogawensis]MBB6458925.1 glycosyltransferase involved in cell wall biosynthesis [Flammeovirga kamogawensis]QWG08502.1 glycosyltransferase [Flammeovirga kamogawensis]TRX66794.1 glycosyltransferase [Flammeovirga kamogawensis]